MCLFCSLAAELARSFPAASPPPPPSGLPAPTLLLPAPHPSHGKTLQEKPRPDELSGSLSGPGDGNTPKPSGAESRGRVEAKAAACAQPSARAGEKHRHTRLPGHSGFWNAAIQTEMCGGRASVYVLVLQVIFEQVPQMKRVF